VGSSPDSVLSGLHWILIKAVGTAGASSSQDFAGTLCHRAVIRLMKIHEYKENYGLKYYCADELSARINPETADFLGYKGVQLISYRQLASLNRNA
jgi:hypothetical protein